MHQSDGTGHSSAWALWVQGNHYLEVQVASQDQIYDHQAAEAFGVTGQDQVVVMVHCGSRGFGHQIGTDFSENI